MDRLPGGRNISTMLADRRYAVFLSPTGVHRIRAFDCGMSGSSDGGAASARACEGGDLAFAILLILYQFCIDSWVILVVPAEVNDMW